MNTSDKKPLVRPKKAYRSPVIRYYGSVRTITGAVGMNTNSDGATSGGNRKTA